MINMVIPFLLFFISTLIISIQDIKTLKLPLILIYLTLILLLGYDFIFCRNQIVLNIIGALFNFLVFFIVRLLTKRGLGLGDVQFSFLTGYFSGFPILFFSNLVAAFLGLCWFGIYYIKYKMVYKVKIPFAPFMALGSLCTGIMKFYGINNGLFI